MAVAADVVHLGQHGLVLVEAGVLVAGHLHASYLSQLILLLIIIINDAVFTHIPIYGYLLQVSLGTL